MNNIKSSFTIKDLENITEIKAHTIRIWEKRYNLLEPERLSRNIRLYSSRNLQKLMNVALLNKHGLKISKIAELNEDEIINKTREFIDPKFKTDKAILSLKLAMYNFDTVVFNQIYSEQIKTKTFSQIFQDIYIPFLTFIGLQWQTEALTPAHEHFISNLIYQKIQLNTEQLYCNDSIDSKETYVLYLPEEEMHEIGLLYLNYELLLKRKKTIYLGRCIPIADLKMLKTQFDKVTWISQFIVYPSSEFLENYLKEISADLLEVGDVFKAVSLKFTNDAELQIPKGITTYSTILDILKEIN